MKIKLQETRFKRYLFKHLQGVSWVKHLTYLSAFNIFTWKTISLILGNTEEVWKNTVLKEQASDVVIDHTGLITLMGRTNDDGIDDTKSEGIRSAEETDVEAPKRIKSIWLYFLFD
jgi:hypothetical protein